jgi:hypothetical protein
LYIRSKKKQFKQRGNKMKKTNITLSIALAAVFSASTAFAEAEVTGKIVHESASFTQAGQGIGASDVWYSKLDTHDKDVFKISTQAKIFIDGDIDSVSEGSTYHIELNASNDAKGLSGYKGHETATQRDALREAYIDTETSGYSVRAGKQQVVWGTADGMKLLDAINPTDYTEMAQNQMEDSRIPVWMINAETDVGSSGSFQFILSEAKGSKFAGLGNAIAKGTEHDDASSDQGHPFMMKGVDMITGQVNGMMNIGPALGRAAQAFYSVSAGLSQSTATVADFADGNNAATNFETVCNNARGDGGTLTSDAICLYKIVNNAVAENGSLWGGAANLDKYNILDSNDDNTKYNADDPDSMFEYLDQTVFGTFDTFVDMTTEYRVEEADGGNLGFKYKDATEGGLNYSLNYLNSIDPNPYVEFNWEKSDGTKLYEVKSTVGDALRLCTTVDCGGGLVNHTDNVVGGAAGVAANGVFTEKHARIHNLGGSLDTAIETKILGPVVLRGEALYQKDIMTPVVLRQSTDGNALGLKKGYVASAFKNHKTDYFKYVLGADITALTNMMVSAQFIQIRNLDYVNEGNKDSDLWKYTGDTAVMSLSNNIKRAEKNKEFYSLFLSKPFGASGEHRWNNILMYEENDGFWNRLDAEFSISDDTQMTIELNEYFGDVDTQFGQLAKSSNVQVGVKYSF